MWATQSLGSCPQHQTAPCKAIEFRAQSNDTRKVWYAVYPQTAVATTNALRLRYDAVTDHRLTRKQKEDNTASSHAQAMPTPAAYLTISADAFISVDTAACSSRGGQIMAEMPTSGAKSVEVLWGSVPADEGRSGDGMPDGMHG